MSITSRGCTTAGVHQWHTRARPRSRYLSAAPAARVRDATSALPRDRRLKVDTRVFGSERCCRPKRSRLTPRFTCCCLRPPSSSSHRSKAFGSGATGTSRDSRRWHIWRLWAVRRCRGASQRKCRSLRGQNRTLRIYGEILLKSGCIGKTKTHFSHIRPDELSLCSNWNA